MNKNILWESKPLVMKPSCPGRESEGEMDGMEAAFSDADEDQYRGPQGHTPPKMSCEDLDRPFIPNWLK